MVGLLALGGAVAASGVVGGGASSAAPAAQTRIGVGGALNAAEDYQKSKQTEHTASISGLPTSVASAPQAPLDSPVAVSPSPADLPPAAPSGNDADATVIAQTATTEAPVNEAVLPTATTPPPPPPTATPVPPTPVPPTPVPPAATTAPAPPAASASVSLNAMEQDMFSQHNQQRAAAGLRGFTLDPTLESVARQRAQDMASKGYFAHTSPSGVTAFTLLAGAGYSYAIAGENIARNNYPDSQTVDTAMTGFMNSAGHRENILEPRFTKVGIAVAVDGTGMKYFAVVFAG